MFNRVLALLVSVLIIAGIYPATAHAKLDGGSLDIQAGAMPTDVEKDIASGTCGTCNWTIDANGKLAVVPMFDGEGALGDWDSGSGTPPWSQYASKITSVAFEGSVHAKTCKSMFAHCSKLESVSFDGLDTTGVTDMASMFEGCTMFASADVSGFDMSSATDLSGMYAGTGIVSVDLSVFDLTHAKKLNRLFAGCVALRDVSFAGAYAPSVTNIEEMFSGCSALERANLSGISSNNVENAGSLFSGCRGLVSVDLTGLSVAKVTSLENMFYRCAALTAVDVSGLRTSNVKSMKNMFCGCTRLKSADVSTFDTANVSDMGHMFSDCASLEWVNISGFDTSSLEDMQYMFARDANLERIYATGPLAFREPERYYDDEDEEWYDDEEYGDYDVWYDEDWRYRDWNDENDEDDWYDWDYDDEEYEVDGWSKQPVFVGCYKLRGEASMTYDENHVNATYARIDTAKKPGYFTTTPKTSIATAIVTLPASSYEYSGKARRPKPAVTLDGQVLRSGKDYAVSYRNNVNAGTATVTVTGKDRYSGAAMATFEITRASLAGADVWCKYSTYAYNKGKAIKPVPDVWTDEDSLIYKEDFTLSYKNNKSFGKATVIVTGKGNYEGTAKGTFEIVPADVNVSSFKSVEPTKATVLVKAVPKAKGYQFRITTDRYGLGVSKTKTTTKQTCTFTGLKQGTKYYIDARAYTVVNDKKVWGSWTYGSHRSATTPTMVGSWKLYSMRSPTNYTSPKRIKSAGLANYFTVTMKANGKGTMHNNGQSISFTWRTDKTKAKGTATMQGENVNLTLKDGKLTFEEGGSSLTYRKA